MRFAVNRKNEIVDSSKGMKSEMYFCPICKCEATFAKGSVRAYFQHARNAPQDLKYNCENYVDSKSINFNFKEESMVYKVRLLLRKEEEQLIFSLEFPIIRDELLFKINQDHLYINYFCKELPDFKLNSYSLHPRKKENHVDVPLKVQYTFHTDNEQLEQKLQLQISGTYEAFVNDVLLFKNINGFYKAMTYSGFPLEGRFFVISKKCLVLHQALEIQDSRQCGDFYFYDLIMPLKMPEGFVKWFKKNLGYELLSQIVHLDVLKPAVFKRKATNFTFTERKVHLLCTFNGIREKVIKYCLIDPTGKRNSYKLVDEDVITLTFNISGTYILYFLNVTSDFYTLTYNGSYTPLISFNHKLTINKRLALFSEQTIVAENFEIECDLPFFLYDINNRNISRNDPGSIIVTLPTVLWIPYLFAIELMAKDEKIEWDKINEYYEQVNLYEQELCSYYNFLYLQAMLMASDYENKMLLLLQIQKQQLKIPKPVYDEIINLRM